DGVRLFSGETQAVRSFALLELQGQHAHADEVAAMDALERLRDDGFDAEHERALRGPVARRTRAILFAGKDDQRHAFRLVLFGSIEDGHLLAVWKMAGDAALGSRCELVAQADVRERATHHHLVVAAA